MSNNSDESNSKSYFKKENKESDPNTNLIDVNTNVKRDNKVDTPWLLNKNRDYLLEYYLN